MNEYFVRDEADVLLSSAKMVAAQAIELALGYSLGEREVVPNNYNTTPCRKLLESHGFVIVRRKRAEVMAEQAV